MANNGVDWLGSNGQLYYNSAGATGGQTEQYNLSPGTNAAQGQNALKALGYANIPDPNPNGALSSSPNNNNSQLQGILQGILSAQQAQAPAVGETAQQLNLNAIQAVANQASQGNSNPANALYSQQLNQYLQTEKANEVARQQANQLQIQQYQNALANTLAQNTEAQKYAAATNQMTQGNINAQAANYQLDSGNAENAKIQALTQSNGQAGLIGSGMGAQQIWQAENAKNVADAQQQGQFQYNRNVSNLETQNTFAQLAQSSAYAQTQEGQQEAGAKLDLNNYLRQAAYSETQAQNALTQWQQQAQTAYAQNQVASNLSNEISGIQNPGVQAATRSAFSGSLTPTNVPTMPNMQGYVI